MKIIMLALTLAGIAAGANAQQVEIGISNQGDTYFLLANTVRKEPKGAWSGVISRHIKDEASTKRYRVFIYNCEKETGMLRIDNSPNKQSYWMKEQEGDNYTVGDIIAIAICMIGEARQKGGAAGYTAGTQTRQ